MSIVVTGAAGFIGSDFIWKLNQEGESDILAVDFFGGKKESKNLAGKHLLDYLEADTFIEKINKGLFNKNTKAIFHIGACSSTTETDEAYLSKNNYEYTKSLAIWALDNKVPFYYASSAATYGDGSNGYSDADSSILTLKPLNLYGNSKQLFDLWLLNHKLTDKVVGFKYFNVFGPNEYHKGDMRSVVLKGFEQIKKEGKIRLFKSYRPDYMNGEQKRDFVYIKDVVDLMYAFYLNGSVKGIYNVGTGKARSWNDLASAIFSALNLPVNIEYIDMPENLKEKYQYFTEADLNKLNHCGIAFNPLPLEKSVADYVKNYLDKGSKHL
ncbi:MAG: ADP-glyceromanno-heptose 6-epimerase [Candidatus Margulisiibacteriota bacterium]